MYVLVYINIRNIQLEVGLNQIYKEASYKRNLKNNKRNNLISAANRDRGQGVFKNNSVKHAQTCDTKNQQKQISLKATVATIGMQQKFSRKTIPTFTSALKLVCT